VPLGGLFFLLPCWSFLFHRALCGVTRRSFSNVSPPSAVEDLFFFRSSSPVVIFSRSSSVSLFEKASRCPLKSNHPSGSSAAWSLLAAFSRSFFAVRGRHALLSLGSYAGRLDQHLCTPRRFGFWRHYWFASFDGIIVLFVALKSGDGFFSLPESILCITSLPFVIYQVEHSLRRESFPP